VVRGDNLRKSMSSYLAGRIERSDKVTVLVNSEVCRVDGNGRLERVTVCDRSTGKKQTCECNGVFVMIGAVPKTSWLPPEIARDEKGFIITGQELVKRKLWHEDWRPPFYLETSCPGIFAAGDARSGSVKRVASAVGEGSMAVAFVHEYLAL